METYVYYAYVRSVLSSGEVPQCPATDNLQIFALVGINVSLKTAPQFLLPLPPPLPCSIYVALPILALRVKLWLIELCNSDGDAFNFC